ncbi:type IV secretion system DNA-binding domain-containing protein [bacterium]|nr:type IV secretion system DNA-binding domain-containing protein [bacterium]
MFFSLPNLGKVEFIFLFVFVLLFLVFILLFLFKKSSLRKKQQMKSLECVLLLVTLPQENDEQEKKPAKYWISLMENFLANIGGLSAEKNKKAGCFSFEIVLDKQGAISFYVYVPRYLEQFFRQQIQAQFPDVFIEQVEDYNIFLPEGTVSAAYLKLQKSWVLPIKTYLKEEEVDPLNAITNTFSKVEKGDALALQIIACSAPSSWHKKGAKIAQLMQKGKGFSEALAEIEKGFFSKFFSGFISALKTEKQKPEQVMEKPRQLSPMEQELVKSLEYKASKAGFRVNIRLISSAKNKQKADFYLNNLINSFSFYSGYEYGNGFKPIRVGSSKKIINDFIYRVFDPSLSFILNTEELASVYHFPVPTLKTPNIKWLQFRKAPAPLEVPDQGIILGENIYRGERKIIRIKREDRRRHTYIIGRTGTGKSYLMTNLAIQDIKNGDGVCVIDPHGDLIDEILKYVPEQRMDDVIVFDPANVDRPIGFNLLEYDPRYPEQKTFVINEMIKIIDKLYDLSRTGGPMFEQYMRNAMLLVMEHPESGSTLMEICEVLANPDFRRFKLEHSNNKVVNDFWVKQAEKAGGDAALSNVTPYITSKLNQFISNDIMRPIIAQQKSSFNLRDIMDEKKIFLVKLSKGKIGDINAYLLGLIIVGKILVAALSRVDQPEDQRKDFYLYIDEFQNFITDTISVILAEARKYRLNLIVAHQYLGQLIQGQDTKIRDAILGTVGTYLVFKIGVEDAEVLVKEFAPVFTARDLVNIERFNCYVKLLVDNQSIRPFSMRVIQREEGNPEIAEKIKEISSSKYGRPRQEVEEEINKRHHLV